MASHAAALANSRGRPAETEKVLRSLMLTMLDPHRSGEIAVHCAPGIAEREEAHVSLEAVQLLLNARSGLAGPFRYWPQALAVQQQQQQQRQQAGGGGAAGAAAGKRPREPDYTLAPRLNNKWPSRGRWACPYRLRPVERSL